MKTRTFGILLGFFCITVHAHGRKRERPIIIPVCIAVDETAPVAVKPLYTWFKLVSVTYRDFGGEFAISQVVHVADYHEKNYLNVENPRFGCKPKTMVVVFSTEPLTADLDNSVNIKHKSPRLGVTNLLPDGDAYIVIASYNRQVLGGDYGLAPNRDVGIIYTLKHEICHFFLGFNHPGHSSDRTSIMYAHWVYGPVSGVFSKQLGMLIRDQIPKMFGNQ